MDSKIEEFMRSEKQTNTDYAHKCVAKKFWKWLSEYSKHKDEREKVCLSRKQHKAFRAWKYDLPPHHLPPQLIDDNIFARFLIHCLVKLKNKKSPLRQAHGWISFTSKGKLASMQNTENVYSKIKNRSVYKDHIPKKALVPRADVHVKIGNTTNPSLYDAYAIVIYNIALLLARRADEARK